MIVVTDYCTSMIDAATDSLTVYCNCCWRVAEMPSPRGEAEGVRPRLTESPTMGKVSLAKIICREGARWTSLDTTG